MISDINRLARQAGAAVMSFYNGGKSLCVKKKQDDTPVTAADLISHRIITSGLFQLTPDIPVISEESSFYDENMNYDIFWLIDPLDGTKEFLYHNNEFTINIALIKNGAPVMGVVYVPVVNILYAASNGQAWKEDHCGEQFVINTKTTYPPIVLVSRFHPDKNSLDRYLLKLGEYRILSVGSSLKFCMIAEGSAQFYPRFSSIKIWDTAAGHAIAMAAGAKIVDWHGNALTYIPCHSFFNSGFEVSSCK